MSYMDTSFKGQQENANSTNATGHLGMVEVQLFLLRICVGRLIRISNNTINSSKCSGKN